jgi:cytochrome c-type biogenesis protein CcmF
MDIQYIGEHLLPGRLGQFLVILAFTTSFVAALGFFLAGKEDSTDRQSWFRLSKWSFLIHVLSVVGLVGILYFLFYQHAFEYDYVRSHSNEGMPDFYLISSFWAGQQGSFMLWIFWNAIIGVILLFTTNKPFRALVMAVFAVLQMILISMLLGIYIPRFAVLAILFLGMNVPLWLLLRKYGKKGWESLVPVYNLTVIFGNKEIKQKWLLVLLSLPVNLVLFVWLPMHLNDFSAFLSESIRLGVSPFSLSRDLFSDNAIFMFPDYMERISGDGLNPLLQNYWMIIHPPTLFLGFALVTVPFAFALAALITRQYKEWVKPVLPWVTVTAMILGLGILMGGMWAYEALSFGGFWAWDPVENASLVPWITLIAGMHTLLIYKSTGHALKATFVLFFISIFLVLYSTFLTRSGILGDSSVHSFTDLGMMGQLIILILAMMLPAIVLLAERWRELPYNKKEEQLSSREFWLFIGSLILLISAVHIIFSTSLPVFNKISAWLNGLIGSNVLPSNAALPKDVVTFYNNVQVWMAVAIALLSGSIQFFKYRSSSISKVFKRLTPSLLLALFITIGLEVYYRFDTLGFVLLMFSALFALIANLQYFLTVLKGKIKVSGASITHLGFALMLIGIVIAFSKSEVISKNYENLDFGEGFDSDFKQNNLYMLKDKKYKLGEYLVEFQQRKVDSIDVYFDIKYEEMDDETGEVIDSFRLKPHLMIHPRMGIVANPSTKKFLSRDIFTHITSIPLDDNKQPQEMPNVTIREIGLKDSFFTARGLVIFQGIQPVVDSSNNLTAKASLLLKPINADPVIAEPVFSIIDNTFKTYPAEIPEYNLAFEIQNISPENGKFTFKITDDNDWLILKAIVFPWINLLWLGVIITMAGFIITLFNRINGNRGSHTETT